LPVARDREPRRHGSGKPNITSPRTGPPRCGDGRRWTAPDSRARQTRTNAGRTQTTRIDDA
jgi:hypothetical protein